MPTFKPEDARVFDAGPECLDRYTVFPYPNSSDPVERVSFIGLSEGGRAVSLWGWLCEGADLSELSYLGEEIPFSSLSEDTQRHLKARLSEED